MIEYCSFVFSDKMVTDPFLVSMTFGANMHFSISQTYFANIGIHVGSFRCTFIWRLFFLCKYILIVGSFECDICSRFCYVNWFQWYNIIWRRTSVCFLTLNTGSYHAVFFECLKFLGFVCIFHETLLSPKRRNPQTTSLTHKYIYLNIFQSIYFLR